MSNPFAKLPQALEERVLALLREGRTPQEVVEEVKHPGVGISRVLQVRYRAGMGPFAQMRANLASRVRHFSPEECAAYQRELAARDAARAAALDRPAVAPVPPVPTRHLVVEPARPELEAREDAIERPAEPAPAAAAVEEVVEAGGDQVDELHGLGCDLLVVDELEEGAAAPEPEPAEEGEEERGCCSTTALENGDEDAALAEAPEEDTAMEETTKAETQAHPAEELTKVLGEIATLDEREANLQRKRADLAQRAVELAGAIEDLARQARQVAAGSGAKVADAIEPRRRTCTGWPGAPKGQVYECDRPDEVCEDCHGPKALEAPAAKKPGQKPPVYGDLSARVVAAVKAVGEATAADVAERVGITKRASYDALARLAQVGKLKRVQVGVYKAA